MHEHVWVTAEQIPHVNGGQVRIGLLDQEELLSEHIASVLQSKLREFVEQLHNIASLHLLVPFQVIEQS